MWELLPLVVVVLFFWFLVIRPARRRALETSALQSALKVGDRVLLTSGFYGTVHAIDDDRLELDLGPGIVTVARGAIGAVVPVDDGSDVSTDVDPGTGPSGADEQADEQTAEHTAEQTDDQTHDHTADAAHEAGDPKEG